MPIFCQKPYKKHRMCIRSPRFCHYMSHLDSVTRYASAHLEVHLPRWCFMDSRFWMRIHSGYQQQRKRLRIWVIRRTERIEQKPLSTRLEIEKAYLFLEESWMRKRRGT